MMHSISMAFLGGAIGPAELLMVLIAVLFLWGPKRLPEIARTLGQTMEKLRQAADDIKEQVLNADQSVDVPEALTPAKPEESSPPLPPGMSGTTSAGTPSAPVASRDDAHAG